MDLATALKASKDGFGFVRDLRDSLKREQVNCNEVSDRLLQIQELLLELQAALSDAQQDNRQLRNEIDEQRRNTDLATDMEIVADGQFYPQ